MSLRLVQLGSNQSMVEAENGTLYFSYSTCVAAHLKGYGACRTDRKYSKTTSKHLGQMDVKHWPEVEEEEFRRRLAECGF